MKIRGFLVLVILGLALVGFLWIMKSGGKNKPVEEVKAFSETKIKLTKTNMNSLGRAITSFIVTKGETPKSLKEIQALHVQATATLDAWGNAIKYERLSESDFRLISAGQDKIFGTDDDIILDY